MCAIDPSDLDIAYTVHKHYMCQRWHDNQRHNLRTILAVSLITYVLFTLHWLALALAGSDVLLI